MMDGEMHTTSILEAEEAKERKKQKSTGKERQD
jgi:hypothetical protein